MESVFQATFWSRDGPLVALLVVEMLAYTHKSLSSAVAEDEVAGSHVLPRARCDLTLQLHKHSGTSFQALIRNVCGKVPVSVSHAVA